MGGSDLQLLGSGSAKDILWVYFSRLPFHFTISWVSTSVAFFLPFSFSLLRDKELKNFFLFFVMVFFVFHLGTVHREETRTNSKKTTAVVV
jgi:hypothetical protein